MSGKPAEAAYMTDYESTDDISAKDLKRLMNTEEKMADRGAAALLMPRKLVVNTCRSVMNDQPIKVYGEDNFDEDTLIKLQEIADFMQVSVMALTIRLKTLRLLEKHSIDEYEGFAIILGGVPE